MTEQLMRYMIYVVVETWSQQNTPIGSEMFLIPLKPPRMKGDLYPLGGYSLLERVCFSIKPAQEDKSLWTIKFCSYHSIKLLDVECCKSIFWIMDLLQESTESLGGKDQVSYSLAGSSRWQVEISISGFNFIAQVFLKIFLK